MRRFLLMSVPCLIASCGPEPEVVFAAPYVPEELRRPVVVICLDGDTRAALGECAMKKDAGLREANRRIEATDRILDLAEVRAK